MSVVQIFERLSETWKALLIIGSAIAFGATVTAYAISYNNLPDAVTTLSDNVESLQVEVARLSRSQEMAQADRDELRCLIVANYRGAGIEDCLDG